jgi:hypothetical protein
MRLPSFLRTPEPARPLLRKVRPWSRDDLTDEQYSKLLDLAQWSDMDSSQELIARAEAAHDLIESVSR